MGTKQCAACGAQISTHSGACPSCGHGSLLGLAGQLLLLAVLLLGIAVASNILPLSTLKRIAGIGPADQPPAAVTQPATKPRVAQRPKPSRSPGQPQAGQPAAGQPADSAGSDSGHHVSRVLALAPCAAPDRERVSSLLGRPGTPDEAQIARLACEPLPGGRESASFFTAEPPNSTASSTQAVEAAPEGTHLR